MDHMQRSIELAPFERAARIYCEKMDINPDDVVRVPHPIVVSSFVEYPRWVDIAERIVEFSIIMSALAQAKAEAKAAELKKDGEHGNA